MGDANGGGIKPKLPKIHLENRGTKGTPNWWVRYTWPPRSGNRNPEPTGTGNRRQAEAYAASILRTIREGTWVPLKERESIDTVAGYFALWKVQRREQKVVAAEDEIRRFERFALPVLGAMKLNEVRRGDIIKVIDAARAAKSTSPRSRGEPLSPREVLHVYGVMRLMFASAVCDERIMATPCTLTAKRGELPVKADKDPEWRDRASFSRVEVIRIIHSEIIVEWRRVLYTLMFLTGARFGEAAGLLWRDYDPDTDILGTLFITKQYKGQQTKTRVTRKVPVHPTLARVLGVWRETGWEAMFGRPPSGDDLIVPRPQDGKLVPWRASSAWWWYEDLEKLGIRQRWKHGTRGTMISLARGRGAGDILRWATHGRKPDVFDQYTTPPWPDLCEQVLKLGRFEPGDD